ncbi:MAG: mechanosensitive ion channel domain-containing protein [Pseudomonadota bacterium]
MLYIARLAAGILIGFLWVTTSFAQDTTPATDAQTLIKILENDDTRNALIASLKKVAEQQGQQGPQDATTLEHSFGRQLADFTQTFFENAAAAVTAALTGISSLPDTIRSLDNDELAILIDALRALALVIVVTVTAYVVLRAAARIVFRRLGERAHDWGFARTLAVLFATVLIDALVVFTAWGLGYFAALYLYGDAGSMALRQSLYLNAFLLVGLSRVVLRAILSPGAKALRFADISDRAARRMSVWIGLIISIIGYGQLLVVPIVNQQASLAAGRGASTLLAFVAIAIAAILVIRSRHDAAAWFLGYAPEERSSFIRFLSRNWHLPVLAYLASLALIVAARPDGLIWPLLRNTAEVIAVIVAGFFATGALSRFASSNITLPETVSARMPTLEMRVNRLIAQVLALLRGFIGIAVAAFIVHAFAFIDITGFLKSPFGSWLVGTFVAVCLILIFGVLLWLVLVSWIDYRLNSEVSARPSARETTLLTLLRNAATIALTVVIVMFVLSEIGIDIAPLIASAGVLGLAIGFGAQKLVQDIITGIFIQLEDAVDVGDVITVSGTTGTVEKLTIRSVTLRDVQGAVHIIPFSSVDMVSNFVKDFSYYVCDLGIAYRENIEDGKAAMFEAFEALRKTEHGPFVRGDLEWFGVNALGDSAVMLRARIKCDPGKQWSIGRAYNELSKKALDARGIEIPFPHQTIYFGEDKDGSAPALHVKQEPAT